MPNVPELEKFKRDNTAMPDYYKAEDEDEDESEEDEEENESTSAVKAVPAK